MNNPVAYFKDWLARTEIEHRLGECGYQLSRLKSQLAPVAATSSRTVHSRLHEAVADYWQAIDALEGDRLERAARLAVVIALEVDFIQQLMAAESAERLLGEGVFFEFEDRSDPEKNVARIETAIDKADLLLRTFLKELESVPGETRQA